MARLARVVVVDVGHHVTQRGNARQFILASDRILPDVESRSSGCDSAQGGRLGQGIERGARPVCVVLEWRACVQRTCLAGPVLFLSAGCGTSVGGFALRGAEPGAGGDGCAGHAVEMVKCGSTLRRSRAGSISRNGAMETTLVRGPMAGIS